MTISVVIVNEVTVSQSPLAAQLTPAWLDLVAKAINDQLAEEVRPYWGGSFVVRSDTKANVSQGEVIFAIVWSLPDAPGAEAYHDWQNGQIVGFLALSTCSILDDVSIGISHELCEINGDTNNSEFARELCDATQGDSYDSNNGIRVSNFVLPAFFNPNSTGPFTYMGSMGHETINAPFQTASGGYQIKRNSGTGETQVLGEMGKRAARAKHWSSRTFRRLAQRKS
jgi:hypothetical protein